MSSAASNAQATRTQKAERAFRVEQQELKRQRLLACHRNDPELTCTQLSARFSVCPTTAKRWLAEARQ